jgi:hypothetical protein
VISTAASGLAGGGPDPEPELPQAAKVKTAASGRAIARRRRWGVNM